MRERPEFTTRAALWIAYAFIAVGLILSTVASVRADLQTAPKLSEVLTLKQELRGLKEQLYAAQLQATQCSLQLADVQFKERAGKLAAEGQALDRETIKALGGDPATDVLDDTHLALKPRGGQ